MNILLLFPMADGQTGPAIKHAFERLGHVVRSVDAKKRSERSYAVSCEFRPDLIFCSRTESLARQVIQIKNRFKSAIACTWQLDTRPNIDYWRHLFPLIKACDYYFVVASRLIPEWQRINPNTFWLPQGLQDETYNKPARITEKDRIKYECDICWAGNQRGPHRFRDPFLEAIARRDVNFKRWGCLGRPQIYNEEHNKMVALSKVNLGISGWPENEKYTSVRNYKILGAGGFLLEYFRRGIYEIFPENLIDTYSNQKELISKVNYWLKNPKERKQIAEQAYAWVRKNATYTHRIKMALDYMEMK